MLPNINKSFFAVAFCLIILAFSAAAKAQKQTDDAVRVRVLADVTSTVQVVTLQSINTSEAQAQDKIIDISPLRDAGAGLMKATGKPNSQVVIEFQKNDVIYNNSNTGAMSVTYKVAVNDEKNQATADLLRNRSRPLTLNEEGELFIWIGGKIDISNAAPGTYPANFVLNIEYI